MWLKHGLLEWNRELDNIGPYPHADFCMMGASSSNKSVDANANAIIVSRQSVLNMFDKCRSIAIT